MKKNKIRNRILSYTCCAAITIVTMVSVDVTSETSSSDLTLSKTEAMADNEWNPFPLWFSQGLTKDEKPSPYPCAGIVQKHASDSGISLEYKQIKLFIGYSEKEETKYPDAEGADDEGNAGAEYQKTRAEDQQDQEDQETGGFEAGASSTRNGIDCTFGEVNCTPVSC